MRMKLSVEQFRGLTKVEWAPSGLSALTGPNGAGKTTLLTALEFMKHVFERGAMTAVDYVGGTSDFKNDLAPREAPVSFRIETGALKWEIHVSLGAHGVQLPVAETVYINDTVALQQVAGADTVSAGAATYQTSERECLLSRGIDLLPEKFAELKEPIAAIENIRLYQNYHLGALRTAGSPATADTFLHPTGLNAFAVLRNWRAGLKAHRERWDFVVDTLREAFPTLFADLEFQIAGQTVTTQFYQRGHTSPVSAFAVANGLLVALIHLCAVASTPDGGIVAIDEPENGLHPYAIQKLLQAMRERAATRALTILLSTHSPVVLNEFRKDPDRLFIMEPGQRRLPVALVDHHDRDWLAQFSLGDLYIQQTFGAQLPNEPAPRNE